MPPFESKVFAVTYASRSCWVVTDEEKDVHVCFFSSFLRAEVYPHTFCSIFIIVCCGGRPVTLFSPRDSHVGFQAWVV